MQARKFCQRLERRVRIEDLENAALWGLWLAAGRYDATRSHFITYALARVRGAMVDWLRTSGVLRRGSGRPLLSVPAVSLRGEDVPIPTRHLEADFQDLLNYLCRGLSGRERQFVGYVWVDGLTQSEACHKLGVDSAEMSRGLRYCREHMRTRYKEMR